MEPTADAREKHLLFSASNYTPAQLILGIYVQFCEMDIIYVCIWMKTDLHPLSDLDLITRLDQ